MIVDVSIILKNGKDIPLGKLLAKGKRRKKTETANSCINCCGNAERYAAGFLESGKFVWGWWCLKCRPHENVKDL